MLKDHSGLCLKRAGMQQELLFITVVTFNTFVTSWEAFKP